MVDLLSHQAKICLTAAGCLIHQGKVLLVKHKKVKTWLNPGGHIEADEAPHQAAEREFWEETGVKVRAVVNQRITPVDNSQYLPDPYATNLHWVSQANYDARQAALTAAESSSAATSLANYSKEATWKKGCEQHLNFMYLVEPVGSLDFAQNQEETDGIGWFSPEDLAQLDLFPNVAQEIQLAFQLSQEQ